MLIGYAAYNTTVNIYGLGKLSENISDFKVYLSNLKVNGAEISGINSAKDEFTISDINGDVTVDIINDSTEYDTEAYLECDKDNTWTFDYTGGEQTFTAPIANTYKLEVWGAQGGYGSFANNSNDKPGYGGYSEGIITLVSSSKLYINVGGAGAIVNSTNGSSGGYNGGGNGESTCEGFNYPGGGGGGGATHISTISGLLSTLSNNTSNILIVAGGGGGAGLYNGGYNQGGGYAGSGGGFEGGTATTTNLRTILGGTQTSGYSFGLGETSTACHYAVDGNWGNGGGGGGLFGGFASNYTTGSYTNGGGAGGSGYIGNSLLSEKSMYCYNCTESSETSTKTVSTTCVNATAKENCSKSGNGYARVTLLSSPTNITTDKITIIAQESTNQSITSVAGKTLTCKLKVNKISRTEKKTYTGSTEWAFNYTGGEQIFTTPTSGTYKFELWGAQGGANANNFAGAAGAYSSGEINLTKGQKFYIYVGGQNGYNGGGSPSTEAYSTNIGGFGGGATDIRVINGVWSNFESLKSRIIVAGGGGGAGGTSCTGTEYQSDPTVTGYGLRGNGATDRCSANNCGGTGGDDMAGYGGQSNGDIDSLVTWGNVSDKSYLIGEIGTNGTFGVGGSGGASGIYYHNVTSFQDVYSGGSGAGGGGGYFGGGGGAGACGWWANAGGSGGGGSSFVSGNSQSKAISSSSTINNIIYLEGSIHYTGLYFNNSKMLSGNESIPSHDGASQITGNTGNGYVKITLIN